MDVPTVPAMPRDRGNIMAGLGSRHGGREGLVHSGLLRARQLGWSWEHHLDFSPSLSWQHSFVVLLLSCFSACSILFGGVRVL